MPVRCPAPSAMPFCHCPCVQWAQHARGCLIYKCFIYTWQPDTRCEVALHVHVHPCHPCICPWARRAGDTPPCIRNGRSNSRRSTCRHLCSLIACALGADPKSENRGETRERQRQLAESTAVSPNATTRRPLTRCDDMMGRGGCSVYVDLAAARQRCSRAAGSQTLAPHLSYMSRT